MKYRPEIDGLKALAMVAVVLFHGGFEWFEGGFVGVDVFFVISGYLITTVLLPEIERGTFSLTRFYGRRARRILPALFLVMAVSMIGAWFWLPPRDMVDFSESIVASAWFVSNFLFWLETGYWGTTNELKPLLHTWTLGIEAQFYLIFPLLLLVIYRFGKRWIPTGLISLGIVSFLASRWGAYYWPSANFFLFPTRLWELFIGAGMAYYLLHTKPGKRGPLFQELIPEGLAILGLVLITFAVLAYDETVPIPGPLALFPTVGTALIIGFASPQTLVGQWLSQRLLVGIGTLSYGVYLWHHPLLAFARHSSLTEPSARLRIALILLSFPLAYLSWRYVERPFRTRTVISPKGMVIFGLVGAFVFFNFTAAAYVSQGFAGRLRQASPLVQISQGTKLHAVHPWSTQDLPEQIQLNASMPDPTLEQYNYGLNVTCDSSFTLSPDCRTSNAPEILVWGDSFAMQLVPGILASHPEARLIQMTKSVCGPFFDVAPIVEPDYPASWSQRCLTFTEQLREWLKSNDTIRYAVLSSPFSQYLLSHSKLMLRNGEQVYADIDLAIQEFTNTLMELKSLGIVPIIFAPPPATQEDVGRCLIRAEWMGMALDRCNFSLKEMAQERSMAYSFLSTFENDYKIISLNKLMCDRTQCNTHLGTTRLYRDGQHLTQEGAIALGKQYNFYRLITDPSAHGVERHPSASPS
jgi:peptidoglycan/LPS O-acetylase OafA/YrhL